MTLPSLTRPWRPALFALLAAVLTVAPVRAQRSPDPALAKAAEMYKARASASQTATELRKSFRVDDARNAELLKTVGYDAPSIARAASEALRLDARASAALLAKTGMDAVTVGGALTKGARVSGAEALDAMADAGLRGVASAEVYRAVGADAPTVAKYLGARGEPAKATAATLQSVYRLSADAVAGPLVGAYAPRDVASWLKDLSYDAVRVRDVLVREGVPLSVAESAMASIGFLFTQPPQVLKWWIRDYAYGASASQIIENAQIVDRDAVLQGAGGTDGTVWIEGENLNHPEVEVWAGTTGASPVKAEIRNRQTVGSGDRLEVFFPSMPDPGFRVTTPGGDYEVGAAAWPVGYAAVERELFETALEGLDITIDTDDGIRIEVGTRVLVGDLEEERENGIETRVTDVNSNGFEITTEAESGGAALVVTISFEESGREFEGRLFGYIPCWKCGTFEVPTAQCGALSLTCLLDFLGEGLASIGSCADPANWDEVEILDTEGIPFTGDLSGTWLSVRMAMQAGGGGLSSAGTSFDFDTNVSIATNGDDVSSDLIDDYVQGRVLDQLTAGMGEIDLAADVVAALNQYAQVMGWGAYLSIQPMPNGRLFVSFPG